MIHWSDKGGYLLSKYDIDVDISKLSQEGHVNVFLTMSNEMFIQAQTFKSYFFLVTQ